jgi:hypothetical protein
MYRKEDLPAMSGESFTFDPVQGRIVAQPWVNPVTSGPEMAVFAIHEELARAGKTESFSVEEAEILLRASEREYLQVKSHIEQSRTSSEP